MSIFITIIVFFIVFSVLILIHEFGHFFMAKRVGIKVEEFGFGLPPRIWGKKIGETIYSINWIPFGGFVRMLGEDSQDPKMLRSKRSFISQSMRARVKVIVAGVLMNFLLAWLLITFGFSIGMQPLLGHDDVLPAVNSGQIVLESGLKVKNVEEGGLADKAGFKAEDLIYAINGENVNDFNVVALQEDPVKNFDVVSEGKFVKYDVAGTGADDGGTRVGVDALGIEFYDFASFPRVKIFELENHTSAYKAGLRAGDVILKVNGEQVYDILHHENLTRGVNTLEYEVYRNGISEKFIVERNLARQVVISRVMPDGPANKAGFLEGDIVISVNGKNVDDALELIKFVEEHPDDNLAYLLDRNGQRIFYEVQPDDGKIGVYLSELMNYGADEGISLYNADVLSSVIEIKNEKYPFYVAPYYAFKEGFRLAELTAKMFVGFIGGLISKFEVPESIAGPVGIAQMTHVFVQEGFIPLIRFVAILSLSLAVINILPFPALDGGRLLFVLIEFILGRRVNQRWEAWIHAFGYFLIILLIVIVTYSDILRLVGG